MGTIGHHTLLYELTNWQIRAAIRGYYRRDRATWEAARFTSFVLSVSFGAKYKAPEDLVKFSWDGQESHRMLSEDEIADLRNLINEENQRIDTESSE